MQFPSAFIAVALAGMPAIISALVTEPIKSPIYPIPNSVVGHTPEALAHLHNTPVCGQMCRMDPQWKLAYSPKCLKLRTTEEKFACFCRSNAYQSALDICLKRQCSGDEREVVTRPCPHTFSGLGADMVLQARDLIVKTCQLYGVSCDEIYSPDRKFPSIAGA
jgi:CFEM domain